MDSKRWTFHRSERVAKWFAQKSNGTYLGWMENANMKYIFEKTAKNETIESKPIDKGAYVVEYEITSEDSGVEMFG